MWQAPRRRQLRAAREVPALSRPVPFELGEETPKQHQSLALRLLLERLGDGRRHRVLDLGPASSGNVAFFAGLSCSLQIADLHQSLFPTGSARPNLTDEAFDRVLAADLLPGDPVDLVLCWDLLNYLEPKKIEILADRLRPYCRAGTLLFTLVSTRKEMPDRPCRFDVLAPELLGYDMSSPFQTPCPRYKEPTLASVLPDFEVEASFLLRNGMQEYLFAYSPTP